MAQYHNDVEYWLGISDSTSRFYVQYHKGAKVIVDFDIGIISVVSYGDNDRISAHRINQAVENSLQTNVPWSHIANDQGDLSSSPSLVIAKTAISHTSADVGDIAKQQFYLVGDHLSLRREMYEASFASASKQTGIPSDVLVAMVETGNQFNPYAVKDGRIGLMAIDPSLMGMQAMISSGQEARIPTEQELQDPHTNIHLGASYLSYLENMYEHVTNPTARTYLAIIAYSWGMDDVDARLRPTPETSIKDVLYNLTVAPKEVRDTFTAVRKELQRFGWK